MASRHSIAQAREVSPWLARFDAVLRPGLRALELGCGLGHDAGELSAFGLVVCALDCEQAAHAGLG